MLLLNNTGFLWNAKKKGGGHVPILAVELELVGMINQLVGVSIRDTDLMKSSDNNFLKSMTIITSIKLRTVSIEIPFAVGFVQVSRFRPLA